MADLGRAASRIVCYFALGDFCDRGAADHARGRIFGVGRRATERRFGDEMTLYFAYGSNMNRALMQRHCPAAQEIGAATLTGYRFVITADGYASVAPSAGELVHGVLWRLTPRDIAALNAYESL